MASPHSDAFRLGGASWTHIGTITGVTGLTDEAALVTNLNLIMA